MWSGQVDTSRAITTLHSAMSSTKVTNIYFFSSGWHFLLSKTTVSSKNFNAKPNNANGF
ncbi:hypothetical protein OK016_27210 [Vibrio chagasii]|nr:hypothetical protein [Vibrio chagasii]